MTDAKKSRLRYRQLPIQLIGVALTVASVLYISREFIRIEWPAAISLDAFDLVLPIISGIGIYIAATIWLAFLWWRLVCAFHKGDFSFTAAFKIYATTQIYKYLPSNVIHLVGRHVAGNRLGVGSDVLALAVLSEMFMLSVAAACMSLPLLLSLDELAIMGLDLSPKERLGALVLFSILFIATSATIGFVYVRRRTTSHLNHWRFLRILVVCQFGYFAFFLAFGLIGIALLNAVPSEFSLDLPIILGAMSLSWLLGFVVPGAPAGVGIREATMLVLLSAPLGGAQALVFALCFRFVTLLGDVFVALIGAAAPKRA